MIFGYSVARWLQSASHGRRRTVDFPLEHSDHGRWYAIPNRGNLATDIRYVLQVNMIPRIAGDACSTPPAIANGDERLCTAGVHP